MTTVTLENYAVRALTHMRSKRRDSHMRPQIKKVAMKTSTKSKTYSPYVRRIMLNMMCESEKKNGKSYPSELQKKVALKLTGLTLIQINNFASNHRRRTEAPKKKSYARW
jgi:hypothetical protein